MDAHHRYTILDTLGTGAYATVYRAFDRDLSREVAIKQIHAQYLNDGPRLDSYWKEAQLLARLDHPCVMTIFDIVRERGWLVLELLEGSIEQRLRGEPIRLDDLRLLLTYMLHALHFLHAQGIIHGDIKPGNLLLDRNGGIKLGDFGIARRVHDDHGSVMKGTTRYIAPEVLSAQFGAVGPASDLYSLGFSAYELLCGKPFNTLFPELETFGRDPQMSWMMWHASRELRLPPVATVLEGVPPDIARVIDRLIEKDISKRYGSAAEALSELQQQGAGLLPPIAVPANPVEEAAARAKMRKRRLAVGALCASAVMSLGVALWPAKKPEPPPIVETKKEPTGGIVSHVDAPGKHLYLTPDDSPVAVRLDIQLADRILLNDAVVDLSTLRPGDQIKLRRFATMDGESVLEVIAWRESEREASGTIELVNAETQTIRIAFDDAAKMPLDIIIPPEAAITINGQTQADGLALTAVDLQAGDRVTQLRYATEPKSLRASSIDIVRHLEGSGSIVGLQLPRRRVSLQLQEDGNIKTLSLEAHRDLQVTLNGAVTIQGRAITLNDLATGDRVTFEYDSKLHRLDATRGLSAQGVVKRINSGGQQLSVQIEGKPELVEVEVPPSSPVTDSDDQAVDWKRLRVGDTVWFDHNSVDLRDVTALRMRVEFVADPRAWAILIGQRQYDDAALGSLPHVERDIQQVRTALLNDYRVPTQQILTQQDATRDRLEADITAFLKNIKSGAQLVVCFEGCGVLDRSKEPVLAVKDTSIANAIDTGLPLRWLIEQIEESPAGEKLLLLNTLPSEYTGAAALPAAEIVRALRRSEFRGVSKSVTVVAACDKDERNLQLTTGNVGLFADAISRAFGGAADANADARVDRGEFLGYVKREASRLAALENRTQTPIVFLPDATPHRISDEGRAAIVKLLGGVETSMPTDILDAAYKNAKVLVEGQPEPDLAYGLVLLKANKTLASYPVFERVRLAHPDSITAHQAIAWQMFLLRRTRQGLGVLEQMVQRLPKPQGDNWDPHSAELLRWAGAMRTYALYAAETTLAPTESAKLDELVISLGEPAKALYGKGVQEVRQEVNRIDAELAKASEDYDTSSLRFQRRQLSHYVKFDVSAAAEAIKRGLEQ